MSFWLLKIPNSNYLALSTSMNRCTFSDSLQSIMSLQLKLKKCHLERREVSRQHPNHSNQTAIIWPILCWLLNELRSMQGSCRAWLIYFQQAVKVLVCDFSSSALQSHHLNTGCQTIFCFATWMIPFGAVIPVLRTTALMSAHNTIFKESFKKKKP